jgi:hypothetical protein
MTTTPRKLRLPEDCKARIYQLQAERRPSASVNIIEQHVGRIELIVPRLARGAGRPEPRATRRQVWRAEP